MTAPKKTKRLLGMLAIASVAGVTVTGCGGGGGGGASSGSSPSSGAYVRTFGGSGSGQGQFLNAFYDAIDPAGNVYVTDSSPTNDRVEVFSATGTYLTQFGSPGTGNGQFAGAIGIVVDGNGHVFVSDKGNNRVEEFVNSGTASSPSDNYLSQFGSSGSGNGQLNGPSGIAEDSNGHIFVCDPNNDRIEEFANIGTSSSPNFTYLSQISSINVGSHQSNDIESIGIDSNDHIFGTDLLNNEVIEFVNNGTSSSPSYTYLTEFGSVGTGNGQLKYPIDVLVEGNGEVVVSDNNNSRLEAFTNSGTASSPNYTYLKQYSAQGVGTWGITENSQGNLYVVVGNSNVYELAPGF